MIPRDLDWLRAVIAADPFAWDRDYREELDPFPMPEDYPDLGENWPPVPAAALDLVPNARFLERRDRELAETQPYRPVLDLAEALRHFRILDRYYTPETLFWDQVFHTPRTRSALIVFYGVLDECLAWEADYAFLFYLIYFTDEVREYSIEGHIYRVGNGQLSLPWSVVQTGSPPRPLREFGAQLTADGEFPYLEPPASTPDALVLDIHGCPTSNPWLLEQTRTFLQNISHRNGWYMALSSTEVDPYAYFATCVDPREISWRELHLEEDETEWHPLDVTAGVVERLADTFIQDHPEEGDRPRVLLHRMESALRNDISVPASWLE